MGSRTKSTLAKRFGCDKLYANNNLWWSLVAEFVSSLFGVLVICCAFSGWNAIGLALTALAFGIIVMCVVQSIGHVSIGHFNPIVTIWMLAKGKISLVRYLLYVLCQSAGAIVGAALYWALTPGALQESLCGTLVTDGVSKVQAFGAVFFGDFRWVFRICAFCDPNRRVERSALLVIGVTVAIFFLDVITCSGSRMNPAMSYRPACIKNICSGHWVYGFQPHLGAVAAAILYHFVFSAPKTAPKPVSSVELLSKQEIKLKASEIENVTIDFTPLSVHSLIM